LPEKTSHLITTYQVDVNKKFTSNKRINKKPIKVFIKLGEDSLWNDKSKNYSEKSDGFENSESIEKLDKPGRLLKDLIKIQDTVSSIEISSPHPIPSNINFLFTNLKSRQQLESIV